MNSCSEGNKTTKAQIKSPRQEPDFICILLLSHMSHVFCNYMDDTHTRTHTHRGNVSPDLMELFRYNNKNLNIHNVSAGVAESNQDKSLTAPDIKVYMMFSYYANDGWVD